MTTIKRVVNAQPFSSNSKERKIFRVVGSVDVDGRGINHEIAAIDPILLLDEAFMQSHHGSPFNAHPHRGLVAITYVLRGAIQPSDNLQGVSSILNEAGGVYYINAGKGIVHNESADAKFPELHWLQLWFNPGVDKDLPRASAQLFSPREIPEIEISEGTKVRIVLGAIGTDRSPVKLDWPMLYLHVVMAPRTSTSVPVLSTTAHGLVYLLSHSVVRINNSTTIGFRQCAELAGDGNPSVDIENNSDETAEFILVCGEPHHRPVYKLSGNGGTLVGDDEESLREAMRLYEKDPQNFGHF